ncbi:hypothetical protein LCGC14_1506160 [marine sediment metagenome]|uniref:Uncharacterized protein n=1 Tax=marine sediment metagenome TaxID=412755 RepID=A0A0F9JNF6_9ZZZZ
MRTFKVISVVDGVPTFAKPLTEIMLSCVKGGAIKVMSPLEYITDRQRRWFKGVCLRDLVKNDENGETVEWWDIQVKRRCAGLKYLKKEIIIIERDGVLLPVGRLTTKGVGKKNMSLFMEEILSVSMTEGWDIAPPDPELRTT